MTGNLLKSIRPWIFAIVLGLAGPVQAATITGTVFQSNGVTPVTNVQVTAFTTAAGSVNYYGATATNAGGSYSLTVDPGSYLIYADASFNGCQPFIDEYWSDSGGSNSWENATPVNSGTAGADFLLDDGYIVSGTVTESGNGTPIDQVQMVFFTDQACEGNWVGGRPTAADGTYCFTVGPGAYYLHTEASHHIMNLHVDEWYDGADGTISCLAAGSVTVAGTNLSGIDFALAPGGAVSGLIDPGISGYTSGNIFIGVYDGPDPLTANLVGGTLIESITDTYTVTGLPVDIQLYAGAFWDVDGNSDLSLGDFMGMGDPVILTQGLTTSVNFAFSTQFSQQYTASGTYVYDSEADLLTLNFASSDFFCSGPEVGIEENSVLSMTETQATLEQVDGYQMTWTRDPGTIGDIVGTWQMVEGPNVYTMTYEADGTFNLVAQIADCSDEGGGDAVEVYEVWTGISRTVTSAGTTDNMILHLHVWAPEGTVSQVQVTGPSLAVPIALTEYWTHTRGETVVDNFSKDLNISVNPAVGHTYTFTVTRPDSTEETYTQVLGEVILDAPQIISPASHNLGDANLGQALNLTWTVPEGITAGGIMLQGGVCSSNADESVAGTVTSTTSGTIILPDLTGATGAYVDVRVHHGDHVFMNTKYDFGSCDYAQDTLPPTAPTGLAADPVSSSRIDLAWGASTDNVAVEGYKIFRDGTEVGMSVSTSYSDTGLTAGTEYCYVVKAYDTDFNNLSDAGNEACATTLSEALQQPEFSNAVYLGGSGDEKGTGIALVGGAVYVSGIGVETHNSAANAIVARYDTPLSATPAWSRNFAYGSNFLTIAGTGEGLYTGGWSYDLTSDGVGGKEVKSVLAKFLTDGASGDGAGGALWVATPNFFSYTGVEVFSAATIVEEGGIPYIYTAGGGQPCSYGAYLVAKYDTAGNLITAATDSTVGIVFDQCYVPPPSPAGGSGAMGVAALNGNIYVAGNTGWASEGENEGGRAALWKYNAALTLQWRQKSTVAGGFVGVAAAENAIYAAGLRSAGPNGGQDVLVMKFDESGNLQWNKTWGGAADDKANGIAAEGNRLYVTGETASFGSGAKDAFLLAFDTADGTVLSANYWGGTADDIAHGVAVSAPEIYVVGQTASFGSGGNDVMVLHYTAPVSQSLDGDINNDGNVDLGDALMALKVIAGLQPAGIDLTADVNGDGDIGLAEILYIIQKVAGMRTN